MTDKSESGMDQEVATASPPLINSKNHGPGRELDALIAEKVMGLAVEQRGLRAWRNDEGQWIEIPRLVERCPSTAPNASDGHRWQNLHNYSTDIADAWLVVEKMREKGTHFDLMGHFSMEYPWCARFPDGPDNPASQEQNLAETAPLAICLAALRAVDA